MANALNVVGLMNVQFAIQQLGEGADKQDVIYVLEVNPRASRSANLVFALFAFIVYYNFMVLGQSWIGTGKVTLLPFLLLLHGGIFAFSALLLAVRHNHWSLRPWWQRRRTA